MTRAQALNEADNAASYDRYVQAMDVLERDETTELIREVRVKLAEFREALRALEAACS